MDILLLVSAISVFPSAGGDSSPWLCGSESPGGAEESAFQAMVAFQKGIDGYGEASDTSLRPGLIKLVDDVKRPVDAWYEGQIRQGKLEREEVLEQFGNYRHLLRFDHLTSRGVGRGLRPVGDAGGSDKGVVGLAHGVTTPASVLFSWHRPTPLVALHMEK